MLPLDAILANLGQSPAEQILEGLDADDAAQAGFVPAADVRPVVREADTGLDHVALDQFNDQTPGIQGTNGKNPFLDKRVREAMSLAVDRTAMVERIMGGVGTPAAQRGMKLKLPESRAMWIIAGSISKNCHCWPGWR